MNIWDFINAINTNKAKLFEDDQAEKDYVPFIVNRSLSYFPDTILYANEMNQYPFISKEWQFEFFRTAIPKKKRFSKWAKKDKLTDNFKIVQEYYQTSEKKTLEMISILTEDQIKAIVQRMSEGGRR
jgi:hypothetical protein